MKLWAIYIGGKVAGCNIELHDFRFCVGQTIEDCYPALKAQWWGLPETLHLDCWGALQWADDHRIELSETPAAQDQKLWFVNLGGYDQTKFTELHENFFLVAETEQEARKRAIAKVQHWFSPHKDNLLSVDGLIDVHETLSDQAIYLQLTPDRDEQDFEFETSYRPIGRLSA